MEIGHLSLVAVMVGWERLNRRALLLVGLLAMFCGVQRAAAAEGVWDQNKAKKMMARVLEVERGKKRPWNLIPWRADVSNAVSEAQQTGKPLFVFFFVERDGPPLERCCPEGRLLRTYSLSDSTVLDLIKSHYIPVKIKLEQGKEFPVNWPALKISPMRTASTRGVQNATKASRSCRFASCRVMDTPIRGNK